MHGIAHTNSHCFHHKALGCHMHVDQARIAFLQGERKGQENLKKDLVRRIKMLEYALKQERAKYHKLKYGTELNQGDLKMPTFESDTTSCVHEDYDFTLSSFHCGRKPSDNTEFLYYYYLGNSGYVTYSPNQK
ncbi:hypothetical protein P7K49_017913 [Saguinus oedipus]|uniref:Striatin N-terminal domain-containing protein n=1 Tax=Saguinus oedipus TaxID=9490 RepID=A0ABQ9V3W3_SAGOE|nr:hypothetical protein P7K49_017913 [Saguinus oedipus]